MHALSHTAVLNYCDTIVVCDVYYLLLFIILGMCDKQESPSARIVLGNVPRIGTGCFDLIVPL